MDRAMLLKIAAELRARAAAANTQEREELLFLAAEYEAMCEQRPSGDLPPQFSVVIPK